MRLIEDLLDVGRISRGKLELRWERLELAPIVRQAIEACCCGAADDAAGKVTVVLPPRQINLEGDPARLHQVISNLLNIAFKFIGPGGEVGLTAALQGSEVVISVKDNGIGIPPDKLDAIFEIFSQVDQSLERLRGGLGIGVRLARRLVELHKGSIEAHSEGLGKGSEFVVRLPLSGDQSSPLPANCDDEIISAAKRRILKDYNKAARSSLPTGHLLLAIVFQHGRERHLAVLMRPVTRAYQCCGPCGVASAITVSMRFNALGTQPNLRQSVLHRLYYFFQTS